MSRTVYLDVNGNEIEEVKMENKSKVRGFEVCNGYEGKAVIPKRGSKYSAGYDFYTPESFTLAPKEAKIIKTGIKAYMQSDEVLQIYIRSSIGIKLNVMNKNCVAIIDSDYYGNEKTDGNIMLALYNYGDIAQTFNVGDRVCQGVFYKYLTVDDDKVTATRSGGIGSTGE